MNKSRSNNFIPTLADVARAAGVSSATVSRVLNTPSLVNETTAKSVLAKIRELGYSPNFGARALASRRTNTVGIIIPRLDNYYYSTCLSAIEDSLQALGMSVLVATSNFRADVEEGQIWSLISRGAEGIVAFSENREPNITTILHQNKIPLISIGSKVHDGAVGSVGFDNRHSMKQLATHALEYGHRSLVYVTARLNKNMFLHDRVEGIRDAMEKYEIDASGLTIVETQSSFEGGAETFAQVIKEMPETTLVMCSNDILAVGAVTKARALNLDVPKDVSITGFYDFEIARVIDPPLTTVSVPLTEMGRHAASELAGLIMDKKKPQGAIILDAVVMARNTLCHPKA